MGEPPVLAEVVSMRGYRDEPDGFIITAWLTSRADRVRAKGVQVWRRSPSTSD